MNPKVTTVRPNPDYTITLTFANGEVRRFDVKPYLDKGIFQELKDLRNFNTVKSFLGSIQWQSGQDFCPDTLYMDYLLSETHAVGKSKAKFFRSFGFDETNVIQFGQGLIKIAQTKEVTDITETPYGTKYVIDGELETPNSVTIYLRTVWIIETGDNIPRLVTAHLLEQE